MAAVCALSSGCLLLPVEFEGEFPADGTLLECSITLRDEGGNVVRRNNLDPDFEGLFYLEPNGDCVDGWGYATLAEAELGWRRFAASKVAAIAGFGPGWCEIEASCEAVGQHTICSENVVVDGDPLPICEPLPPPPVAACFETLCGEAGAGCDGELVFGDLGVGQSVAAEVTYGNCGEPGAPSLTVAPGPIAEAAGVPLFDFVIAANGCVQDPFLDTTLAPGESCDLEVAFAPLRPGAHEATIGVTWTVDGAQSVDELALRGGALGGELDSDPGPVCFDPENLNRTVTVQNLDAAAGVQVQDVSIETSEPVEFTVATDPLPFLVAGAGSFAIEVTAVTEVEGQADLEVRWGGDADLDLVVDLEYRSKCPDEL